MCIRDSVLFWHKKTCSQEQMFSSGTTTHAFLRHKNTCLPVPQEDMCSCATRKHVFLCHNIQFSRATRRHVFLSDKKTCVLVAHEQMSCCATTRNPQFKETSPLYHVWDTLSGHVLNTHSFKTYHCYTMCFGTPWYHFFTTLGTWRCRGHCHHNPKAN